MLTNTVSINRATVLTLWATVIAGRLGFDHDEAHGSAATRRRSPNAAGVFGAAVVCSKRPRMAEKRPNVGETDGWADSDAGAGPRAMQSSSFRSDEKKHVNG